MKEADARRHPPLGSEFGSPQEILRVLHQLRGAITEMLSATGVDVTKTRATARELELDRNLVWQVTHLLNTADILTASRTIPSRAKIKKLCSACLEHGASDDAAHAVLAGFDQFERMIEVSLGSREEFETMLASLEQEDVTARQESTRKLAFTSNSAIWGVQAELNFKACFTAPSPVEPDKVDVMQVSGLVGFRRLRPVPWPLSRSHAYSDTGETLELNYDPVRSAGTDGMEPSLLTEFCSDPPPKIDRVVTPYGHLYELASGAVGNAGKCTCVFAEHVTPRFERYRTSTEEFHATMLDLVTPSEHAILDLFMHRDLGLTAPPEVMLLDRLSAPRGYKPEEDAKYQLPMSVRARGLGSSPAGAATPLYTPYSKVLAYVVETMGFAHGDFDGFRVNLKHPPVPAALLLRTPLKEKPRA